MTVNRAMPSTHLVKLGNLDVRLAPEVYKRKRSQKREAS